MIMSQRKFGMDITIMIILPSLSSSPTFHGKHIITSKVERKDKRWKTKSHALMRKAENSILLFIVVIGQIY